MRYYRLDFDGDEMADEPDGREPMKVLVTGATGFVGRALCQALAARGNTVDILTRRARSEDALPDGVNAAHTWDPLGAGPAGGTLADFDAVVHLAGESVAGRWSAARREAILASRREGTAALVRALASAPPRVLVSASAIGYYGDRGDEELREAAAPGADFLAEVCQVWEEEAGRAMAFGTRVVSGRIGIVLDQGGGALERMLPLFRAGLGGRLGHGRQWWSWIHRADLVRALLFLVDHDELSGPVNLTAPAPVRQRDFARALAKTLRRPAVLPAPAFALRGALGGFSVELLASRRVLPGALGEADFSFLHPEIGEALAAALRDGHDSHRSPE